MDRPSIHIVGVGVFGGGGNFHYELELLELVVRFSASFRDECCIMGKVLFYRVFQMRSSGDSAQTLSWHSLAVVRGTYGPEDCVNDVAEIKFDRPVLVKVIVEDFYLFIYRVLTGDVVFTGRDSLYSATSKSRREDA